MDFHEGSNLVKTSLSIFLEESVEESGIVEANLSPISLAQEKQVESVPLGLFPPHSLTA